MQESRANNSRAGANQLFLKKFCPQSSSTLESSNISIENTSASAFSGRTPTNLMANDVSATDVKDLKPDLKTHLDTNNAPKSLLEQSLVDQEKLSELKPKQKRQRRKKNEEKSLTLIETILKDSNHSKRAQLLPKAKKVTKIKKIITKEQFTTPEKIPKVQKNQNQGLALSKSKLMGSEDKNSVQASKLIVQPIQPSQQEGKTIAIRKGFLEGYFFYVEVVIDNDLSYTDIYTKKIEELGGKVYRYFNNFAWRKTNFVVFQEGLANTVEEARARGIKLVKPYWITHMQSVDQFVDPESDILSFMHSDLEKLKSEAREDFKSVQNIIRKVKINKKKSSILSQEIKRRFNDLENNGSMDTLEQTEQLLKLSEFTLNSMQKALKHNKKGSQSSLLSNSVTGQRKLNFGDTVQSDHPLLQPNFGYRSKPDQEIKKRTKLENFGLKQQQPTGTAKLSLEELRIKCSLLANKQSKGEKLQQSDQSLQSCEKSQILEEGSITGLKMLETDHLSSTKSELTILERTRFSKLQKKIQQIPKESILRSQRSEGVIAIHSNVIPDLDSSFIQEKTLEILGIVCWKRLKEGLTQFQSRYLCTHF